MIFIDKYAYSSKLKHLEPLQKLLFAMLTLGVCLWADNAIISVSVLVLMGGVTALKGGTPLPVFIKLLTVPMSFLLVGVLTIAISMSDKQSAFLISLPFAGKWAGLSLSGLLDSARLFLKALGAVSCLYFLSLSTPVVELLNALRKLRVPSLIVEMMGLIYRFIFVLLETAYTITMAQDCRLGYFGLSSGYRSLSALASALFIRAYKRSEELYTSLEARGYEGELNVLEEPRHSSAREYAFCIIVNMLLIVASLFLKSSNSL
ncbi:MAG: cobalt ECF transporter T component CbiQ [Clostridia bacterium]|nr:cobalt ECF transporter T component CbiQ [Clostridia bacterium]